MASGSMAMMGGIIGMGMGMGVGCPAHSLTQHVALFKSVHLCLHKSHSFIVAGLRSFQSLFLGVTVVTTVAVAVRVRSGWGVVGSW